MINKIEQILNSINNLAKDDIRNKEDIRRIIESALEHDQTNLLRELSFQAKYLQGLLKIIKTKNEVIDDKYFINVRTEYTEGIKKVKELLEKIIEPESQFIKNIFNEKYFQLTHHSMSNLTNLCNDFSYVKLYFNDLKTEKNKD